MIEINEKFTVAASPQDVYNVLSDPNAVVECVAGAAIGEQHEDGSYDGSMTVKFSALRISFKGKVALDLNPEELKGTVRASGRDGQGGTKFQATAAFEVIPQDGGTTSLVTATGEVVLSGKLASVIEGAAGAVVRRMTGEFVDALSVRCASASTELGPTRSAEPVVVKPVVVNEVAAEGASVDAPALAASQAAAPTVGVLLLHGFASTPNSVRAWGQALADGGMAVNIPRLPGHGTRWKDLNRTTWKDWYDAADAAFTQLRAQHDQVFVMGISLGGTIALRLAEIHGSEVSGVVVVNAVAGTLPGIPKLGFIRAFVRSRPAVVNDAKKSGAKDVGYERIPTRAGQSLREFGLLTLGELSKLTVPVLITSSQEDHVVAPENTDLIWSGISADRDRRRHTFSNSYHAVPLDNDAPQLFEESISFVNAHTLASKS
jgi:carboxylesterase